MATKNIPEAIKEIKDLLEVIANKIAELEANMPDGAEYAYIDTDS